MNLVLFNPNFYQQRHLCGCYKTKVSGLCVVSDYHLQLCAQFNRDPLGPFGITI